jgi:hypothetical protein
VTRLVHDEKVRLTNGVAGSVSMLERTERLECRLLKRSSDWESVSKNPVNMMDALAY